MTTMAIAVTVDAEFEKQLVPLSDEEFAALENGIRADGVTSPLIVWQEENILLDGHNRKRIADRLGIGYSVKYKSLPDRTSAADWIDNNQLGRRNLTPDQMTLLLGRRYNRTKLAPGEQGNQHKKSARVQNDHEQFRGSGATARRIAAEHGVGEGTVRRAGEFAAAVESLKPLVPDIEQRVISGRGPTRVAVKEAAKVAATDPAKARALVADPKSPEFVPVKEKRLPGKPLNERLRRATATIVSAIDVLEMIDFGPLSGSKDAMESIESLVPARTKLTRFINTMKGE